MDAEMTLPTRATTSRSSRIAGRSAATPPGRPARPDAGPLDDVAVNQTFEWFRFFLFFISAPVHSGSSLHDVWAAGRQHRIAIADDPASHFSFVPKRTLEPGSPEALMLGRILERTDLI